MNQASRDFEDAIASMQARRKGPAPSTALVVGSEASSNLNMRVVTPKYVDWFQGQRTIQELRTPAVKKTLSERDLAEKTLGILRDSGQVIHDKIAKRLPHGHRMESAILAELLRGIAYLGTCRVGRVPIGRTGPNGKFLTMAEFYVTNFDANITTKSKHFYNYPSPLEALEAGPKFFGIGIITDQHGRRLSFDKRFGDSGVYYQTKDEALASYAIAAISTGKTFAELLSLDRNNEGLTLNSLSGLESVPFGNKR